jgi:hypothetical protein
LVILREGMARRRQHRQTESQARNDFEIPDLQQINAHGCPQKSTDITAIRQARCPPWNQS